MVAIAQSATSSKTNPVLALYVAQLGRLADPEAMTFSIWDISDDAKRLSPVRVFPPAGEQAVHLTNDRVGLGHYAAAWTVGGAATTGRHEIRWAWNFEDGPTIRARREFDVLAAVGTAGQPGYALVSDFRDEDFEADDYPDARIMLLIARASAFIDKVTGRWFEPRYMDLALDGKGKPMLGTRHPIIAIEEIATETTVITDDAVRIYNRHLVGMRDPDDRAAPRLEYYSAYPNLISTGDAAWGAASIAGPATFPRGQQNVHVKGVFGYTDPDGSSEGVTPDLIREATMLLVLRKLPKLSDPEGVQEAQERHRIISERTREQSYQLAPRNNSRDGGGGGGGITGDPAIDNILDAYSALRIA